MSEPRWDDLRLFLEAARTGSFTAAARARGLEQSTVSRRIAALEEALGGALFLRSRSGLSLTERGAAALPLAEEAQRRILEIFDATEPDVRGLVRLAVTDELAVHGLVPGLPALMEAHPRLRIALVTGAHASDLSRREADLALRFFQPGGADLVVRRLAELPLGIWIHRDLVGCPPGALPWIALELAFPTPEAALVARLAPDPPRLVCHSYGAMLACLRAGLGAAAITDVLASRFPELVRLEPPEPLEAAVPLFLVGHVASRRTPRIAAVWAFLVRWAEQLRVEVG